MATSNPFEFLYCICIEINRSFNDTIRIWNDVATTIDGETVVKKRKGDYDTRKGLTQEPIVKEDIAILSPLHALLRSFDFCCKIMQFLKARIFKWTESKIELGRSYAFLVNAKADIHSILNQLQESSSELLTRQGMEVPPPMAMSAKHF